MKRLTLLIALPGIAGLASGCAAVSALPMASMLGSPSASGVEIHSQTGIRLEGANFIVTKTNVVGQSKGFSLLGILTIVPAKFTTAMNRLYARAEMKTGRPQTLANLTLEKNSLYFILFSLPQISVRADVIEFVSPNTTNIPPLSPGADAAGH